MTPRTSCLADVLLDFVHVEPDLNLVKPQDRRHGPADAVELF